MKPHLRITVETLLRKGRSQREIERLTGVDRKTIRRYDREAKESSASNSPGAATGCDGQKSGVSEEETPPPRPPARAPKEAYTSGITRSTEFALYSLVGLLSYLSSPLQGEYSDNPVFSSVI